MQPLQLSQRMCHILVAHMESSLIQMEVPCLDALVAVVGNKVIR